MDSDQSYVPVVAGFVVAISVLVGLIVVSVLV